MPNALKTNTVNVSRLGRRLTVGQQRIATLPQPDRNPTSAILVDATWLDSLVHKPGQTEPARVSHSLRS